MIDTIHYFWNWLDAAFVAFTLLGYAGLMMGHGEEHRSSGPKSGLVRKPAARKEKGK